jgi:hypothetical protein
MGTANHRLGQKSESQLQDWNKDFEFEQRKKKKKK